MKKFLLVVLLSASALMNAQVSIGIRIGPPPPTRVVRVRPAAPGRDFVWVDGYWYVEGGRYIWHSGYWTRPPFAGAVWVGPWHDGSQFYGGYWNGPRGRFDHDHRWDRDRGMRDYDRH